MLSGRCKFFHRIGIEFFTVFIDYILQGQASGLNLDIVDYGSFVEVVLIFFISVPVISYTADE